MSNKIQDLSPSYVSLETASLKSVGNYIYIPNNIDTSNMLSSPSLEPSVILYQDNQPTNPQLWDGNFTPVSMSSVDEFLTSNIKNIVCSLLRTAIFIKQQLLGNKTTKNIPQIVDFSFASWEFINTIYKSS